MGRHGDIDQGEALDIMIDYLEMLQSVRGRDPIDSKVMILAYRDFEAGECDSGSGVPLDDLETRLSKVIESLTEDQRRGGW
jgi:hypothetical protein